VKRAIREASMTRQTRETTVNVEIRLDGSGEASIDTGIGFFNHMLETLCKHAMFDMKVSARGDLHVDAHHLVEDVGIVIGKCVDEALGERVGIARFGHAIVPMDDALILVAVDLSGRSYLHWDVEMKQSFIGSFNATTIEWFFKALCDNAGMNLHVVKLAGKDAHHIVEAIFKAFACAIRQAVAPSGIEAIPSTKGKLK
jgi:imidazoleglycerol-phosphate dehydratase